MSAHQAPPEDSLDSTLEDAPPTFAQDDDARLWKGNGWTARIIRNDDDEGWAVEMTAEGACEPSLVGPWTMGRDKKNPKPIDASSFATLVKGANEVVSRAAQQLRATLHRSVSVESSEGRRRVDLDIVPDEDDPHAILTVHDRSDAVLAKTRVAHSFKLTSESARQHLVAEGLAGSGEV